MIALKYDSARDVELIIIKCDMCGDLLETKEKLHILETSKFNDMYIGLKYIPKRFHLCSKCYNEFCSSRKFSMEIIEDK